MKTKEEILVELAMNIGFLLSIKFGRIKFSSDVVSFLKTKAEEFQQKYSGIDWDKELDTIRLTMRGGPTDYGMAMNQFVDSVFEQMFDAGMLDETEPSMYAN
jgi:hypothetical protein